jgi:hypothetical protein
MHGYLSVRNSGLYLILLTYINLQIVGCSIAVESQTKALTGVSLMLHLVI